MTNGRQDEAEARRAETGQPARRRPTWMAISVELGPGMRLVAPRIQELLLAQPLAALDDLVVHQGDVRGRAAEGSEAELEEQARQPQALVVHLNAVLREGMSNRTRAGGVARRFS